MYFAPDKQSTYVQAKAFRDHFGRLYPSVASFDDDLDACLAHMEYPAKHRRHISSTNLAERAFLEEKRRSNTIPRFFDEKSGLKLAFASLIRASYTWRKIQFTFDDQVKILELCHKLGHKAKKEQSIKNHKRVSYAKTFSQQNQALTLIHYRKILLYGFCYKSRVNVPTSFVKKVDITNFTTRFEELCLHFNSFLPRHPIYSQLCLASDTCRCKIF